MKPVAHKYNYDLRLNVSPRQAYLIALSLREQASERESAGSAKQSDTLLVSARELHALAERLEKQLETRGWIVNR